MIVKFWGVTNFDEPQISGSGNVWRVTNFGKQPNLTGWKILGSNKFWGAINSWERQILGAVNLGERKILMSRKFYEAAKLKSDKFWGRKF